VGCLGPSAIAGATSGTSAPNELETEAAENPGKCFRIIVPCDDGSGWDLSRIQRGQEEELSVP
jgi:hypothetical protein